MCIRRHPCLIPLVASGRDRDHNQLWVLGSHCCSAPSEKDREPAEIADSPVGCVVVITRLFGSIKTRRRTASWSRCSMVRTSERHADNQSEDCASLQGRISVHEIEAAQRIGDRGQRDNIV
jgi:hypothetical protein